MVAISVIIPIYNCEKYIGRCLNSILKQEFDDYEIICINDGSTDNSLSILEQYARNVDRIKIINQENQGVSVARNIGVETAKGEYIYFIDADDWINEKLFADAYNCMKKNNADIVLFDIYNVYGDTIVPTKKLLDFTKKVPTKTFYYNEHKEIIYQSCTVWSKLFRKQFLIDYDIKFPYSITNSEDTVYWLEFILCNPKIAILNKHYYYYYKNSDGASLKNINNLNNQFKALNYFINTKFYLVTDSVNQLLSIDYFTRLAVYVYSSLINVSNFTSFETSIHNFIKSYPTHNFIKLLSLKGYRLALFRWFYTVGKKIVLSTLKYKYSKNCGKEKTC